MTDLEAKCDEIIENQNKLLAGFILLDEALKRIENNLLETTAGAHNEKA